MDNLINGFDLKLIVPQQEQKRREIKNIVDKYFLSQSIVPPVSYEKLTEFATKLTEENKWGFDYFAFVMICCGNAIWRNVVESIPYERRILLLPECLKNSTLCKADNDEFGLLCASCGACSISEILNYAEDLGYIAMVTEGTTLATQLVESGKVDAIIGVGCMESLQKIFESITKYAVPGLGIPLLGNGCINTQADVEWLKKEIGGFSKNKQTRIVNSEDLKKRVESIFNKTLIQEITHHGQTKTEKIAYEAVMASGKRWRPFLTVLVYEALCSDPDGELSKRLAIALECFHKASLIHDDIEDNDTERNGSETLHSKYGIPVGLNLGDLLIGEGYKILSHSNLPANTIANCIKIAAEGHVALSIGQGEELLSKERNEVLSVNETIQIFKNKTSAAFKVSVLIGATVAESPTKLLQILAEFADNLGIAYQIKDDLSDYSGNNGDISNRDLSILLSMLFESLATEDKIHLYESMPHNKLSIIFNLIAEHDIENKTKVLLKKYINAAYNCLDKIESPGLKLALHEIMGKIFGQYI